MLIIIIIIIIIIMTFIGRKLRQRSKCAKSVADYVV